MKNWILRVTIGLLTFLLGVSSSQLWSLRQSKSIQINAIDNNKVDLAVTTPTETWRRIVVSRRFSLYIPTYLDDEGHSVSGDMAVGAFRKGNFDVSGLFYLSYYSDHKIDANPKTPTRYRNTVRSEVTLGGKRSIMITAIPARDEIWGIHDLPRVDVYFPDIGHGQKLYISLTSGNEEGIEVAKRVLSSIEFP